MEPVSNADKLAEIRARLKDIARLEDESMYVGPARGQAIDEKIAEIEENYHRDVTFLLSELDRKDALIHVIQQDNSLLESVVDEQETKLSRLQSIQQERDDWIKQYKRLESAALALEIVISRSEQRAIDAEQERDRYKTRLAEVEDESANMIRSLQQQVNKLTFELKIKDAELKSVDKLGVKYQQRANALTKVLGEIDRILTGDDVDAFDIGECHRLITEALQSIKDTPREEQTP